MAPQPHTTYVRLTEHLYYAPNTQTYHKLSFLPSTVVFHNEQVSQPPILALTPYDPIFIALNQLIAGPVPLTELPHRLTPEHF